MGLMSLASIIGLGIGAGTMIILCRNLKLVTTNIKKLSIDKKKERTMEFISKINDTYNTYDVFQYKYREDHKNDLDKGKEYKPPNDSDEFNIPDEIIEFLNTLEQYGTGVKYDLYEIDIFAEYYGGVIEEIEKFLAFFIKCIRQEVPNYSNYSNYSNYQFVCDKTKSYIKNESSSKKNWLVRIFR